MPPPRRTAPEPQETHDVTVITVGALLWVIALVVTGVWWAAFEGPASWVGVAGVGVFLGLVGIRNVRRRRAAR